MRTMNGLLAFLSAALLSASPLASCTSDNEAEGSDADTSSALIDASNLQVFDAAPDAIPAPDATPAPDAMPAALACAGDTLPSVVANPPITISGSVQSVVGVSGPEKLAVPASITALQIADDDFIIAVTSVVGTTANTFSLVDPKGGSEPMAAYIKATAPGHIDTYLYPPYDIYENFTNALFLMFGDDVWGIVPLIANATQADGNGAIMVIISDCDQQSVESATVSITPDVGEIRYGDSNGLPSSTLTSTQGQGIAFIFNVPPGSYTVDAERGGVSFREHSVAAFADAATTTIIVP